MRLVLGVSWLDRLELMIRIEDQFAEVEITDDDADQIEAVGDLVRYIDETAPGSNRQTEHRVLAGPFGTSIAQASDADAARHGGEPMAYVTYQIVRHDNGWAYTVNGVPGAVPGCT